MQEDEQVFFQGSPRRGVPDRGKRRRDFIPPGARDVEEVSLRRPTAFRPDRNLQSQERGGRKSAGLLVRSRRTIRDAQNANDGMGLAARRAVEKKSEAAVLRVAAMGERRGKQRTLDGYTQMWEVYT